MYDKDEELFYFLSNKKNGRLGFYMTRFNEKDPLDRKDITLWDSRLDISDVSLEIIRSYDKV